MKVHNPGTDQEEHLPITNVDDMTLVANPGKTLIPPGQEKQILIFSTVVPTDQEQVFRVTFSPVIPESVASGSGVRVVIAYQALVFLRPENAQIIVNGERQGTTLTLTNTGTKNAELRGGQHCEDETAKAESEPVCIPLPSVRLYAGQSLDIELPAKSGYVDYGLFNGESARRQRF